jgi:hypothetical protein
MNSFHQIDNMLQSPSRTASDSECPWIAVGAEVQPGFTGVPVAVPDTPFVDANEQTIRNTDPNRVGLGDFTRNDGTLQCLGVPRDISPQ